jgi:hypothetical protein
MGLGLISAFSQAFPRRCIVPREEFGFFSESQSAHLADTPAEFGFVS